MKFKSGLVCVCSAVALVVAAHGQGVLRTITFEGPPRIPPGDGVLVTNYYEDSMTFTPITPGDQFGRTGGGVSFFPENGTSYILQGSGASLAGSRGAVSRFGLSSVDLSEFSTIYPFPTTVQFVGYRSDGTIVTADFTTDGIIDGTGPLTDFQTFYFDQRFSDLRRFEVPSYGYALDNLVFFDVPEPGTSGLLTIGAAIFGLRFISKQVNVGRKSKRVGPIILASCDREA